jgi:predicted transcriptional regulator of viral defense system
MRTDRPPLRIRDVLAWVADDDVDAFSIDDLVEHFGAPRKAARELAARMVAGNYARGLKAGVYLPLPPNYWKRPDTPLVANWHLLARHLAAPDPYFLAYYTAMELHNMIQHPLTTVFIATTGRKGNVDLGPVVFRFVRLVGAKFQFGHGPRPIEAGRAVEVADLERTFLDAVDRPDLCGGIEEVVRGFARRHDDLERERLLRYVVELGQPVTTKRLGFLFEIVGHADPRLMRELERLAGRLKTYAALVPGADHATVERSKRWELDVNVDPERLLDAMTT